MKDKISKEIIIRYILYQVPGLALLVIGLLLINQWITIPGLLYYGIIAIWLAKDFVLFFYTWKAYVPRKEDRMLGKRGIAMEKIIDGGYISVDGERWKALNRSESPIEPGQEIFVVERKGLTLSVMPSESENEE